MRGIIRALEESAEASRAVRVAYPADLVPRIGGKPRGEGKSDLNGACIHYNAFGSLRNLYMPVIADIVCKRFVDRAAARESTRQGKYEKEQGSTICGCF